jgi:aspartate aminotransferase
MPTVASHAHAMPRSGIRQIMDAAWDLGGDVIGLHVGEPSFPTPQHVLDGARNALDRGETRYVPNAGIPELRVALARKVTDLNGFDVVPEQIVVTAGGMQALHNSLTMVLSAGDEVLIPDPGWPNFAMVVQLLQARPVRYPLRPSNSFLPDVADLDAAVTDRTVAINSPSNPLGTVLTPDLASALVDFAIRRNLWLISDECYDAITFEQPNVSLASAGGADRVITCFSFSKTYAMTGLRVGYAVLPVEVAEISAKLQEPMISCVNAPAQWAALAALDGPQDAIVTMRRVYQDRRNRAMALLDELGVGYLRPNGAFYLWIDVRNRCAGDVREWALELLRQRRVAVAPGTAFGPAGEGWARLSLATDTDQLLEGCRRIAAFEVGSGR